MSLPVENYCNDLWPLIYEPYYREDHARELPFYATAAAERPGPVLEIGCGTGVMFYKLWRQGIDLYGLDVSTTMLDALLREARAEERDEVGRRISCQDMRHFRLDRRFAQVLVPARTFLHAASLADQLATLRQIRAHLEPGGRLLLNFFTPDPGQILQALREPVFEPFDRFVHPLDGATIDVEVKRVVRDLHSQHFEVYWRFHSDGLARETRMDLRWVHRDEFELMLQLCGFSRWQVFGDGQRGPFGPASDEMFWIAEA